LKSETSLQVDGGFEWNTEHLSFTANLFYNSIDNFIFFTGNFLRQPAVISTVEVDGEDIPAYKFGQAKALLSGAEFTVDIHPHPLDWLHFENTLSLVKGRFSEAIGGTKNMPFIPAARLLSDLRADLMPNGKRLRNGFIKLELELAFDQNKPFTAYDTETSTPGYALINAGIGTDVVSAKAKTMFSIYFTASILRI
jgi:iron complex outermembrane receptor protein